MFQRIILPVDREVASWIANRKKRVLELKYTLQDDVNTDGLFIVYVMLPL